MSGIAWVVPAPWTRPEPVIVVTRVPQPTGEGSRPVIPMPWVRFETAGSCPILTGLPESPP